MNPSRAEQGRWVCAEHGACALLSKEKGGHIVSCRKDRLQHMRPMNEHAECGAADPAFLPLCEDNTTEIGLCAATLHELRERKHNISYRCMNMSLQDRAIRYTKLSQLVLEKHETHESGNGRRSKLINPPRGARANTTPTSAVGQCTAVGKLPAKFAALKRRLHGPVVDSFSRGRFSYYQADLVLISEEKRVPSWAAIAENRVFPPMRASSHMLCLS